MTNKKFFSHIRFSNLNFEFRFAISKVQKNVCLKGLIYFMIPQKWSNFEAQSFWILEFPFQICFQRVESYVWNFEHIGYNKSVFFWIQRDVFPEIRRASKGWLEKSIFSIYFNKWNLFSQCKQASPLVTCLSLHSTTFFPSRSSHFSRLSRVYNGKVETLYVARKWRRIEWSE